MGTGSFYSPLLFLQGCYPRATRHCTITDLLTAHHSAHLKHKTVHARARAQTRGHRLQKELAHKYFSPSPKVLTCFATVWADCVRNQEITPECFE